MNKRIAKKVVKTQDRYHPHQIKKAQKRLGLVEVAKSVAVDNNDSGR